MEFLLKTTFCAPLYQIGLLLLLSTLALLFGKAKAGLLINYLFALYWAYVFDREYLIKSGTEHAPYFPWLYFGFGFAILIFALIGFFASGE